MVPIHNVYTHDVAYSPYSCRVLCEGRLETHQGRNKEGEMIKKINISLS